MKLKDGEFAVKLARNAVEKWVKEGKKFIVKDYPEPFNEKRGVFTTLNTYPEHELRGCIGFPYPTMKLIDAIVESAIAACKDPRFLPLGEDELDKITVEVSILTKPELIKVKKKEDYLKEIKIGRDGLIITNGIFSGLLLPQVPVEQNWGVEEFLEALCMKASLPRDAWKYEGTEIKKFHAEIFYEESPRGRVKIKSL